MVDLEIDEWEAIGRGSMEYPNDTTDAGDSPTPYKGVFNGNGHKLTLIRQDTTINNIALFHTIAEEGVVKNLNLDVNFQGRNYVTGVAVRNYGTIERVTVEGEIKGTSNLGGIVALNGKGVKTSSNEAPPRAKILHCVNKAAVSGTISPIGGIAGSFLGEMRCCGNEGTITTESSSGGLGGLIGPVHTVENLKEQPFIISDCYNAGNVVFTGNSAATYVAGLVGRALGIVCGWEENFKISDVFSYGALENGVIIIANMTTNVATYTSYHVSHNFANTYYRESIGTKLFDAAHPNGTGLGTDIVKEVIKEKTADEFASAEMAALLNNGRTGADAPWEYVAGNAYPTLKSANPGTDPGTDPENDSVKVNIETDIQYPGDGTPGVLITTVKGYQLNEAFAEAAKNYVQYGHPQRIVFELDEGIIGENDNVAGIQVKFNGKDLLNVLSEASASKMPFSITFKSSGTSYGELTLDQTAASHLGMLLFSEPDQSVEFVVREADSEELEQEQRTALESLGGFRDVYEVGIVLDGEMIENFQTFNTPMEIRLPFKLENDETGEGVWAFYVPKDGSRLERMTLNRGYDYATQKTVFGTLHLSNYATAYEQPVAPTDGGGSGGCDAGAAGMAVLAALGMAMVTRRRSR
jgi:hypothetical protein